MQLRPYQTKLIDDIRAAMAQGKHSILAVLGCGGGKSVIAAQIAHMANVKGNRVLFIVHRAELCEQIRQTFTACGVDMTLTDICMVQTVSRHLNERSAPRIIICDEAHHSLAAQYRKIYDAYPDAVRLGFTATPCRLDSRGFEDLYDELITSVTTAWLIDNHYLSPYQYYSVKLADADKVHTSRGDYDSAELADLMEQRCIYGDTVSTWRRLADGKRTIIYCASCDASQGTSDAFTAAGVVSYHLDGKTPQSERQRVVEGFRRGNVTVLCNVDLFGEGFDVPDCECVVLLRPTKSLTLYIQQSMRSMRYREGKTALIIDHVANYTRHGLPDDVREWTLAGKKRREENKVKVIECPKCCGVFPSDAIVDYTCPRCGYIFEQRKAADRAEMQVQADAELVRITSEMYKNAPYETAASLTTFDELKAFGAARGYKIGWALHQCVSRGITVPGKYRYAMRYLK